MQKYVRRETTRKSAISNTVCKRFMEEEKRIIEEIRQLRKEAVRFHSCAAKAERERWVVQEFLSALGIRALEQELTSPPEADPVDVVFKDAFFQVKEIYDPHERRQTELKDDLRRAETATCVQDVFAELVVTDKVYFDIFPLIAEFAADPRYTTTRARIDLLFYVTRTDATINLPTEMPSVFQLWRSISCLFGPKPIILAAQRNAPSFIGER